MRGRVDLVTGMFGKLAIIVSIPLGKLVRIPSGVMAIVFVGSNDSHCRRVVSGSWLGYCSCK
jgi:hypothetical protein